LEKIIYFDNSATTPPCETAIKYINKSLQNDWGNPSSLHSLGITAEQAVTEARKKIASLIGAKPNEIYFTSGGSEANNTAIFGAAYSRKKRGNRIVTTTIEHPSVLNCMKKLENEGFEVIYLPVNKKGVIEINDLSNAINEKTILVSIMAVNNEVGTVQPIGEAADIIKRNNAPALLHSDCVQAFGKLPINFSKLKIDLITASAHKVHGPKGIGFLYKKNGVSLPAFIYGGGQESGMRSGTESTPLISGFSGAIDELANIAENLEKQKEFLKYAKEKILKTNLVTINSPDDALPYILNISVNGYRSEILLHYLDSKGIFVSSGSACAKGNTSYVLSEMGFDKARIDSSLRLSFSRYNTTDEIDAFCSVLEQAAKIIRKA